MRKNHSQKTIRMKKLFFVLICLSAAVGTLMAETAPKAGLPLKSYSLKISEASLHQFSQNATQISYFNSGDTLGAGSFDTLIYLGESALETKTKKSNIRRFSAIYSGLRDIGFEFPMEQDHFAKFGLSASGYIYFGNDSITPGMADENGGNDFRCSGRNLFGIGILRNGGNYDMNRGRRTSAEVIAQEDTKIQYERQGDTLYVGFENMYIREEKGNLDLKLSYQLQIGKDGSASIVFGNIELKNEESLYYLVISFTSSQITQNINFNSGELDRFGNANTVRIDKDAAAQYSGKKYMIAPPPPCTAFNNSEFNIDLNKVVREPEQIRFEYNFYDKEIVDELLMVLSESQASIKDRLEDGVDYPAIGYVDDMPVVWGRNGSAGNASTDRWEYFGELKPNTRYWLHVFPYNSSCSYGPVFGREITYAVATTMEPLESIAIDTVSEDGIRLKISGKSNYLLGFSNRKIISYNGKPASNILQQGKKYQAGDTIHFLDDKTWEDYEADIYVVAVNQSEDSYTLANPKPGTDYYFYAWAMSEEEDYANYSSDYVEATCRTATQAPGTIDFKGLEWETTPVGWEIEQGSEVSTGPLRPKFIISTYVEWEVPVLAGEWFFQTKSSGTASMWAISPWFKGSGRLQAVFNGAFYKLKNDQLTGNSPVFQPAVDASDSIVFEVQERGETEWHRIGRIDSKTSWTADFNDFITDFFMPKEEFRFRMTFYQDGKTASRPETSGRFYALRSLTVEAASNCLYPVNIVAPKDSMGYRTAKIMWTDPNEGSGDVSFVVKYRMSGESEWIVGGRPKTTELVLEGLLASTDYVAEVNTVCSSEESSSPREVSFTTARNMVYQEEFKQSLPELEYYSLKGEAGDLMELGSKDEGWVVYTDESAQGRPSVVGFDKSFAKVNDRWLLTPVLYSGFDGKVKLRVSMAAWLDEANERKAASGVENDTLYIYRSSDRSFAQPETVGKVVLDNLTPEYRDLEFVFDVKALVPNVFAFYLSKVKGYGADNNSSLAISEIEFGYSEENEFPAVSSLQAYDIRMTAFTIGWKGEAQSYAVVSRKMGEEEYDTAYTIKNEYNFSELEAGTRYGVQVFGYYGKNRTLPGPTSKEQAVNTLEDPNSCGTPNSLMAEYTKGTDSAILRWITGRNNRSSIVHLKVNDAQTYDTVMVHVNYHTLLQLQPNAVYHWRVQGVCDTAVSALSEEAEFETEFETKAEGKFAQGLNIRVNGKQIVVENKGTRFIKSLKVYSPSGILLRTYPANTADNMFIQTDLRQGMVIIKAEGEGGESYAVKAFIM